MCRCLQRPKGSSDPLESEIQATVQSDESGAVNTNNLMVRECDLYCLHRKMVILGLSVGGNEHDRVSNKIVGICGG